MCLLGMCSGINITWGWGEKEINDQGMVTFFFLLLPSRKIVQELKYEFETFKAFILFIYRKSLHI